MRYYAIADLHGRFDLLEKAFTMITADAESTPYEIITLGDYIDRGPQSKEVIDFLIKEEVVSLMGNHEAMAVQVCLTPTNQLIDWWMGNGGQATIQSYNPDAYYGEVGWMGQDHLKWMASLPLYYETEKQVFVHAGISFPDVPLDEQDEERMVWMLYGKNDHGGWQGKHVVHGHHQFADGPHEWSMRTDLDTFAWHEGRLVIGVFDDTQGKACRYIEVLGDDYKGNSSQG